MPDIGRGLPPLTWLRAFEASARHLSFARGAADLNLTATAVSYQVRSLEQRLHHPLFERLPRGLRLTEMGAAYLPDVRRAFEDIAATTAKLFGHGEAGRVTIRAPISFLALWLAPRLPEFQVRHPDIDILLLSTVWADAPPDPSVDVDIRFGSGAWPGCSAELLFHDESMVVAAPGIAVARNNRQRLKMLAGSCLIHVVGHENHWAEVFRRVDGTMPPAGVRSLRVDNSVIAVTMAKETGGAAIVLRPYAEWAIATLGLAKVFSFMVPVEASHYLLSVAVGKSPPREVLLFRDWIVEAAGD